MAGTKNKPSVGGVDNGDDNPNHHLMSRYTMNLDLLEAMQDLIRKDQKEQARLRVCGLIEEGLASGPALPRTCEDANRLHNLAQGEAR